MNCATPSRKIAVMVATKTVQPTANDKHLHAELPYVAAHRRSCCARPEP
jgi:hypothetical protein